MYTMINSNIAKIRDKPYCLLYVCAILIKHDNYNGFFYFCDIEELSALLQDLRKKKRNNTVVRSNPYNVIKMLVLYYDVTIF
jgi:hypothetical protein